MEAQRPRKKTTTRPQRAREVLATDGSVTSPLDEDTAEGTQPDAAVPPPMAIPSFPGSWEEGSVPTSPAPIPVLDIPRFDPMTGAPLGLKEPDAGLPTPSFDSLGVEPPIQEGVPEEEGDTEFGDSWAVKKTRWKQGIKGFASRVKTEVLTAVESFQAQKNERIAQSKRVERVLCPSCGVMLEYSLAKALYYQNVVICEACGQEIRPGGAVVTGDFWENDAARTP